MAAAPYHTGVEMKTLTVTNLTNSPFDLEGGVRLPAMGKLTHEFSEGYAEALRSAAGVEVHDPDPLDRDGDGKKGGSSKPPEADDLSTLRAEYHEKFGKRPFMGWDAATLREKLAAD